jgi:hypothetical protein
MDDELAVMPAAAAARVAAQSRLAAVCVTTRNLTDIPQSAT